MGPEVALAIRVLAAPIAIGVAAVGVYLTFLGAAAFAARPAWQLPGAARRRFAVLIPAHDEASVIDRLLASLREQTYPAERHDVFVVADNCTDATAVIARRAGAIVYERRDVENRAKGHALRWLLDRVRERGAYDAYVVFDADSIVSPDFLSRMDARLESGSRVVQAHYRVLNSSASSTSTLREAALASLHYLRPRGRSALGLSCGLKGNGMCFDARTLDDHGWSSVGLAEDVELHLALARAGIRVDFAPEALVQADMPTTLRDASSQNLRWEAGRLAAVRRSVPAMLLSGIKERDAVIVDAAIEQLIPPLSVVFAAGAASALAGALAGSRVIVTLGALGTTLIVGHIIAGLIAVGAPRRTYFALARAPAYIGWKLLIYTRALFAAQTLGWVRTRRDNAQQRRN
jgi:cellulose synthase/poly-beta-1,6-N-acetylglucosamine synthase-like glycosyltransferase